MAKRKAPPDRREQVKGQLKEIFMEILDDEEVQQKIRPPEPEPEPEPEDDEFSLLDWLRGGKDDEPDDEEKDD